MPKRPRIPIALTIASSDSGGGAGIQADLKTFAALGVHGTSAITCVTAQSPKAVLAIQPCHPRMVCQQLETVCAELPPAAVKTGMLFSRAIISAVADFFRRYRRLPLIVDPVLTSTSGARLLETNAVQALQNELLPIATLVTPNLDEAQILAGAPLRSVEDLEPAARIIQARYGCAALVKGGHLRRSREAVDVFYDGNTTLYLSVPFIRGLSTHGTGCTYSAAITAYLALGCNMPSAIRMAKNYLTRAIARSTRIGRYFALNPFWACVLPGHRPPGRFGLAKATARRACQRLSPETQTRRLQI